VPRLQRLEEQCRDPAKHKLGIKKASLRGTQTPKALRRIVLAMAFSFSLTSPAKMPPRLPPAGPVKRMLGMKALGTAGTKG
jgi:hypothetical protein